MLSFFFFVGVGYNKQWRIILELELLDVTFSEITQTQKPEKALEMMVCTSFELVEGEDDGQAGNAKEPQFLRPALPCHVVTFLGRCASR